MFATNGLTKTSQRTMQDAVLKFILTDFNPVVRREFAYFQRHTIDNKIIKLQKTRSYFILV